MKIKHFTKEEQEKFNIQIKEGYLVVAHYYHYGSRIVESFNKILHEAINDSDCCWDWFYDIDNPYIFENNKIRQICGYDEDGMFELIVISLDKKYYQEADNTTQKMKDIQLFKTK